MVLRIYAETNAKATDKTTTHFNCEIAVLKRGIMEKSDMILEYG